MYGRRNHTSSRRFPMPVIEVTVICMLRTLFTTGVCRICPITAAVSPSTTSSGRLIDEDSAILSIYYGEEMNEDSANEIAEKVEEEYPDVEVEVHYGGQPMSYCE